jgi:hypothetical protein
MPGLKNQDRVVIELDDGDLKITSYDENTGDPQVILISDQYINLFLSEISRAINRDQEDHG